MKVRFEQTSEASSGVKWELQLPRHEPPGHTGGAPQRAAVLWGARESVV